MYGEELWPDQMSISRTLEAVWMIPLENPNKKEISCKSGEIVKKKKKNHLHEDEGRSMRQESSAEPSHRETNGKGEVAGGAGEAIEEKSGCH